MKSELRSLLLLGLAWTGPRLLASQDDYAASVMAGISNHGHNGGEPYVTAGDRGIEYVIEAEQGGWSFVLKGNPLPGAKYYLNGSPVAFTSSGIRMSDRRNQVLVASP